MIVPSIIVEPCDGSLALAFLGKARRGQSDGVSSDLAGFILPLSIELLRRAAQGADLSFHSEGQMTIARRFNAGFKATMCNKSRREAGQAIRSSLRDSLMPRETR